MTEKRRYPANVPTMIAALWLAVFPFWLLGEKNALAALDSGEVPVLQALLDMTPQSYSNLTRAKWDGMLVLTAVTVLAVLIWRLVRRQHPRMTVPLGIAFAYGAWLCLSARFGTWADTENARHVSAVIWGAERYEGLITLVCYMLIFLSLSQLPVRTSWVLSACSISVAAYALIVLMQYAGLNPLNLFPSGRSIRTNYEFQGTLGNIDMVSAWLCLLMPGLLGSFVLGGEHRLIHLTGGLLGVLLLLCMEVQSGLIALGVTLLLLIALSMRRPDCRAGTALVLGMVLLLAALRKSVLLPWLDGSEDIMLTASAAALLLLLAGLLALGASMLLRRHPLAEVKWKWLIALTCGVLAVALTLVYVLPAAEGSWLWELQETLHGRAQDSFGSERLGVWRMTADLSTRSPWFGTGPDTFYYAFRSYLRETSQQLTQNFDNPHNLLLQTAVNCGIPAAVLFLALCWATIHHARKHGGLLWALMAVGFLTQSMFTFSICLVSPMFYCVLGLCCTGEGYMSAAKVKMKE